MKKTIDKMRGWLTCLVVLSLMIMTPFHDPQIALASEFAEELQWNQMETDLRDSNSMEWHMEYRFRAEAATDLEATPQDVMLEQMAKEPLALKAEPQDMVMQDTEVQGAMVLDTLMQDTMNQDALVVEEMILEKEVSSGQMVTEEIEEILEEVAQNRKKQIVLPEWRISINAKQMDLLERCVMAEGGGESYECQVAITCVIINRVLSDKYPNTIEEVIQQPGQFSTWPTMIENVTVSNQVKQAVREALADDAIPENVLYFRANRYHRWGNRYRRIDNTYFSTP